MTDKLHCPFCGAELLGNMTTPYCPNPSCNHFSFPMPSEIWQALIDGKKAQEDLKYVKEELECANHNYSVLSEQKEIAYQNYLKITGDLQKQLQKAQDALKVATDFIGFVNTSRHADGALAAMAIGKLNEITSITKQENE